MRTKYHVITGAEEVRPIYRQVDEFFEEVKREIGDRTDGPSFFEKLVFSHCSPFEVEPRRLDGNTQILLYKHQPVATVVEIRDRMNYVRFTFFKNLDDII